MYIYNYFLKLFFLRRFYFSLKRKSGIISLIILFAFVFTACQPTPEAEIVVNKGEGALESAIHSDPAAYPAESNGRAGEETLWDALGVPERTILEITGPVYGGTLHIEMDAAFHLPEVTRVPVLLVGRLRPSAADKQRIAEAMTGRRVFFGTDPLGNQRWLNIMERERRALAALDDQPYGPTADYESLQNEYTESIQRLLTTYTETEPGREEPWTGTWADDSISVFTESGQHIWIETEIQDTCSIQYDATDANGDGTERVIDANTARRLVENALDVFGCTHYEIVSVHPADQRTRDLFNSETGIDDGSFTVSLRPMYEGIPVFEWNTYFGSDTAAQKAGLSYAHHVVKERIFADVQSGRLASLTWIDPLEVLGVENENVPLLPFDEILDIFQKQVYRNIYLDSGELNLKVTDIYFSYRCVKKRDSDLYYLLPVWDFIGHNVAMENLKKRHSIDESILAVNAVDGSILNDLLGY